MEINEDNSDKYKQPCDICRTRRVRCNRALPSCQNCLKRKVTCTYNYITKKRGPPKRIPVIKPKLKPTPLRDSIVHEAKEVKKGKEYIFKIRDMTTKLNLNAQISTKNLRCNINQKRINDGVNSLKDSISVFRLNKVDVSKQSLSLTKFNIGSKKMNCLSSKKDKFHGYDYFRIPVTKWSEFSNLVNFNLSASNGLRVLKSISRTHFNHFFTNSLLKLKDSKNEKKNDLKERLIIERNASHSQGFLYTAKTTAFLSFKKTTKLEDIGNHFFDINQSLEISNLQSIYRTYIDSYFLHVHPYFPILSKRDILNGSRSPLHLIIAICYAGSVFMEPYSALAVNYFERQTLRFINQSYTINRIDIISTILMFVYMEYQLKNFSRGWIFLGIATKMAYTLGLYIKPSKHLSSNVIQKRLRIWWWVYILNKLYIFGLFRPWCIEYSHCSAPIPSNFKSDLIDDKDSQYCIYKSQLSLMFTKHMATLFHKLSFIYSLQRDMLFKNDKIDIDFIQYIISVVDKQYKIWDNRMTQDYYFIVQGERYDLSIVKNYIINLRVLFLGSWVEMIRTFVKPNLSKKSLELINRLSETTTISIIAQVEKGDQLFLNHGNLFRLYCLSNATATQLSICFSYPIEQMKQQDSFTCFKTGFLALAKAALNNRLPRSLCKLIISMAKTKDIDLFQFLPKELSNQVSAILNVDEVDQPE